MQINFVYRNKKINLNVKKVNWLNPRGLMFRRQENAPALLFEFEKPVRLAIHSWFVFFPFWAVWLDDKNRLIEEKIVKPWSFRVVPKQNFHKLVEIPFNKRYKGYFPTGMRKI